MASTYSSNLKIELMGTGENSGTWGSITNTNLGTALEQAVIGLGNPDYTSDANLTITITDTNASQAARALVLNVTSVFGSLTQTRELIVPTIQKQYIVQNNTTGGQSITVKTSAGTGITVPNGRKAHLYVNGTDVIQMFDFVDINGGTIDGATVGAASASTGAFTSLTASGATTLNGAVALGDASGDLITVPGTVNSNLLFTDATYDIGASGATRPRDLFLSRNLTVGGTLTLAGGVNLNGNVTVGDASTDTLTINSTITSNLIFTDNTYDIGASGATRPRNLFLAGNATVGGSQTLTGALTVDSTTDSSSTTTGSIQTDGGLGVAKALFVGTTANIAGAVTLSGGTANGVAYLNGSKVVTSGSALVFDGTSLGVGTASPASKLMIGGSGANRISFGAPAGTQFVGYDGTTDILQIASYNDIRFQVNAYTEQMRLTSTGLGIGTSSPAAKLEVFQTSTTTPSLTLRYNSSSVYANHLMNGGGTYVISSPAANGVTSGGMSLQAGASIGFYTNGTATNVTPQARLDASGNLGLGVEPSAWGSNRTAIQLGGSSGSNFVGGATTALKANNYFDTGDKYVANGFANAYLMNNGTHAWYNAPSGTAGNAITFTQAMTLDASGNLIVGTTSASERIYAYAATGNCYVSSNRASKSSGQVALRLGGGTGGTDWIFYQDTNSDNLTFFGNSGNRMVLTTTGNLGVGTTSPSSLLTVAGTVKSASGTQSSLYLSNTAQTNGFLVGRSLGSNDAQDFFIYDTVAASTRLAIDSSGNVGIGTTSPSRRLDVQVASDGIAASFGKSGGTMQPRLVVKASESASTVSIGTDYAGATSPSLVFETAVTERARIDSSGNFLVGTTSGSNRLVVDGLNTVATFTSSSTSTQIAIQAANSAGANSRIYMECPGVNAGGFGYVRSTSRLYAWSSTEDSGPYVVANGTSWTTNSDARLKTNVQNIGYGLNAVLALSPKEYEYKIDEGKKCLGFIAQDVVAIIPELVDVPEDSNEMMGIEYQSIIPVLVKAIQEQQAIIESLKARLDAANL
jgi:hypothetical protein